MPSAYVEKRATASGTRYRVKYRIGGRESALRFAGSFATQREARARQAWVLGELAAMRVPDLELLRAEVSPAPTLREACEKWAASRVDVRPATLVQHRVALGRALPILGDRRVDTLTPQDVAALVGELAKTRKRETVRKTVMALGMVLDHAGIEPNPARDKRHVKLPREEKVELVPPTAEHVQAVHDLLPSRYRLPLLVLDGTGMRLGELEGLAWGDVDEPRGRWRVTAAVSKTGRGRWVSVPPVLFEAVLVLVPRDDRTPERKVFQGFGGERFRTQIARSCIAAGVPTFSPHALRHRRISLWHRQGEDWAAIGARVGQRSLSITADTYTHVLPDEAELDYSVLVNVSDEHGHARAVLPPCNPGG